MCQLRLLLCVLLAMVTAGCSASGQFYEAQPAHYIATSSARPTAGPYILGPGDRLRIKSYDDTNVTGEYEVNSAGFVSVPLVGQVKASGMTTRKLEDAITARLKNGIAKDPKINVEIATYASFYIYGEVKKAGVYPYQPGLTVADAIATAGGLTYRADENTIFLQHPGAGSQLIVPLGQPTRIAPGDNIRVAERFF
jgi:polysaccharide export outer membrane protein